MGTQECHHSRSQEATLRLTEQQLWARVVKWQQRLLPLGVAHFRIDSVDLVDECTDPDAAAGVTISDLYDSVKFEFDKQELAASTEQKLDERIIHEWLHVAWRDYDHAIAAQWRWLPEVSRADYEEAINHEYEGLIDRLARVIYALYSESC